MKRLTILVLTVILVSALYVMARDQRDLQEDKDKKEAPPPSVQANTIHQQVVINISHPSSGGHNRNFPSQQPQQQQQPVQQQENQALTYSRLQLPPANETKPFVQNKPPVQTKPQVQQQAVAPQVNNYPNEIKNIGVINQMPIVNTSGIKATSVIHHHPYEPNYVRKKLQKLGVTVEPGYITNREEVIHTDREHSIVGYPKTGVDNQPLKVAAVSYRHFNDSVVRTQMSLVSSSDWQGKINGFNKTETDTGHYYWHKDDNFNYCHYIDNWGYHWYGWYVGSNYFWTRYFNNRWWWYDADYDRWCFWNDGFWWWQDPYHVGDLYCYDNAFYIPVNSAEDNVAVTVPDSTDMQTFTSPDNTRVVKVIADTQDAFLYDTANPPAFNPVYLASGVQDVLFSNSNNGRPLEMVLRLNDGSFDMFDSNGNPYNPGTSEEDQTNQPVQTQ